MTARDADGRLSPDNDEAAMRPIARCCYGRTPPPADGQQPSNDTTASDTPPQTETWVNVTP